MGKAEMKKKSSPSHSAIWSAIKHSRAEINSLKIDVATIKTDVGWLKDVVKRVDQRLWWILGSAVTLGVIAILAAVL